ncbi:MAG: hypothetical protein ACKO01_11790 [Erythrobacter sp.]
MIKGTPGLAAIFFVSACQGQTGSAPDQPVEASPVASPAAATPAATAAEAAACAAGETPIFACAFKDGKHVAVCGTAPGTAEYRFGGDTPELVLKGGERANVMYSGGGESQLAFANGSTRYIVFSRMVRTGFGEDGNNPAISDGIVIERAGAFQAIRVCEDPKVLAVDVNAAETFLPAGKASDGMELFTEETMRADPPGQ